MSMRSGLEIIIPENKLKLSVKHNKDRPRSDRSDGWSEDLRSVRQLKRIYQEFSEDVVGRVGFEPMTPRFLRHRTSLSAVCSSMLHKAT